MQIVRTVIWVLLIVVLGIFSYANWEPVTVRIWDNVLLDTMLPAIVIMSFAIGFVPMWLYHRAAKWQLNRRIAGLEMAARNAAAALSQIQGHTEPAAAAAHDPLATSEKGDLPPPAGAPQP